MQKMRKNKDKNIRIFYELETETGTVRVYIHPSGTVIKAYVRQLSANERATADAVQDSSDIEFTINKRNIKTDMYVDFYDGFEWYTYQIGPKDNYEFYDTEVKFRAHQVNSKTYIETRWTA